MQADFGMGVSLLKREDESLQNYFLSFSPMAPFFGVPWRFAPSTRVILDATPVAKSAPTPKPRKVVVEDAVELSADAAAVIAAATQSAEAAIHSADAAAAEVAPLAEAPAAATAVETPEVPATSSVEPATLFATAPAMFDDLTALKGVGPKLQLQLNELGLYTYAQIAELTEENLDWLDEHLSGVNKGRARRDDWVGQAEALRTD